MKRLKGEWRKLCSSYSKEKLYKLVKDTVAAAHDLYLEVEEEDFEELSELYDRVLTTDWRCKGMEISSKDK